jgi:hypothetical protein
MTRTPAILRNQTHYSSLCTHNIFGEGSSISYFEVKLNSFRSSYPYYQLTTFIATSWVETTSYKDEKLFPRYLHTLKMRYLFLRTDHFSYLIQMNTVNMIIVCVFKVHFNIILVSTSRYLNSSLPFKFLISSN